MKPSSPTPLLLVAGSAVLGHLLLVTPLVDLARGLLGPRPLCPVVECTAGGRPMVTETTPMIEVVPAAPAPLPPAPWAGRFLASSLESREIWRGRFAGMVQPTGPHLAVTLREASVTLSPEAPAGVLRGIRIDLAESTPDGSWRIAREGRPVEVGVRYRPGQTVGFPAMHLSLPRVGAADLQGRWLVVTMLVDTPGGFAPLAHAHMPFEMARGLAETARRGEAGAPALPVP